MCVCVCVRRCQPKNKNPTQQCGEKRRRTEGGGGGRKEGRKEKEGGGANLKTRTPHANVGKNGAWKFCACKLMGVSS